ncbi:MAG TPA: DUF2848 domain-containing protein [Solirubrobacterales bacterium]
MPIVIETAIVAGWTGRDQAALREHIAELSELGVTPPSKTPLFYRVSAARVTCDQEIESTDTSSGEVEAVLLAARGKLWVGLGSDHTDREVEAYGVAVSKQMCEKPIAPAFWAYDDVAAHWDQLELRSWIVEGGSEVLYQEGNLGSLLPAEELISSAGLEDGSVMFCGTFAARDGIRPSDSFRYELVDPVLERRISSRYLVRRLPLIH